MSILPYLLTEKKNYKNYQNLAEKLRKINEIKNNELNKECFDCGSCYPEYISINNGVFICNNCILIHNKFPKEISLTLKNNLSSLNHKELEYMYQGGNQKLIQFIHNDFPELIKFQKNILYQTRAMQYYRDYLNYLVNSGPEPIKPSKNINAYELIDSNKERKYKKYEKINIGTKNKKRNKSVGNKKKEQYIYYSKNKNNNKSKNSRNSKSFRKNNFLDIDDMDEEKKRHKSFYKEMNKLFNEEEEENKKDIKKEYKYYRKINNNNIISNNLSNNITDNNNNYNDKYIKYNSKTSQINKYKEYPIENIYNNNYFNLTTTKNIFMVTPMEDNLMTDYRKLNMNIKEIYTKPINLSNISTYKANCHNINENLNNNYYNYLSTNTYKRKKSQKKIKELFANININKNKTNKKEANDELNNKNKNNYYTFREINNSSQIKEIRISKIGGKKSFDINEYNYKKINLNNLNKNNNKRNNIHLEDTNDKILNFTQVIENHNNNTNNENKIKNINIFFDKNKNKRLNEIKNIEMNNSTNNNTNTNKELNNSNLSENIKMHILMNQKISIRNKYKMQKK